MNNAQLASTTLRAEEDADAAVMKPKAVKEDDQHNLATDIVEARLDSVAAVALTDRAALQKAAEAYPALMTAPADEIAARMLRLKSLLPGAQHIALLLSREFHVLTSLYLHITTSTFLR